MVRGQITRRDRLVRGSKNDIYKIKRKLPYPIVCQVCSALCKDGLWSWEEPPLSCHKTVCPACRRILDDFPAGQVEIRGPFYRNIQLEMINLIKNREKIEKKNNPMERIMNIGNKEDHVLITTTGMNLAKKIGETLSHSYQGNLHFRYGDSDKSILVTWER